MQCFLLKSTGDEPNFETSIEGTYQLANLLQELFFAKEQGLEIVRLSVSQLAEDPVKRLTHFIKKRWGENLTRRLDARGIAAACPDIKHANSPQPRIYVPRGAPEQYSYYCNVAEQNPSLNLSIHWLPEEITGDYIRSTYPNPGILALGMTEDAIPHALPFIVPGGRFNELYNWDSFFCAIGMIEGELHVVKSILRHFIFEVKHYGKILNANRSYYLGRAQPPFLTDLALRVYEHCEADPDSHELLKEAILAAMKEYFSWWTSEPRLDPLSRLSRYRPVGQGVPPECEPAHFAHILGPYARKYKMTLYEFIEAYNNDQIQSPELDTFFLHDRAVRESGHDTSNRLEGVCADLATIDLNTLLYKYEIDIAKCLQLYFGDCLTVPAAFCCPGLEADKVETSAIWNERARVRKNLIDKYCWNESAGMYYDYNTVTKEQQPYECATTLWPLWAGLASPHQASLLVPSALSKLEQRGGICSSSEASRGPISTSHPQKQWDYPLGTDFNAMVTWKKRKGCVTNG